MNKLINYIIILIVCLLFIGCSDSDNGNGGLVPDDNSVPEFLLTTELSDRIIFVTEKDQISVNFVFVKGNGRNLMIDSGYDDYITPLNMFIQESNPGRVDFIINTHYDGDHIGGNSILDNSGTIIGDQLSKKYFRESNPTAQLDLFSDTKNIQFDGLNIECLNLPVNGHTMSDVIVYFPEEKILVMGDLYFSEAFPHVSRTRSAKVQNLFQNWDYIIENYPDAVTVIAGHGRYTTMEEFISYTNTMKAATEEVKKYIDQGKSRNQAIDDNILADWNQWSKTISFLNEEWWIGAVYDSYE